MRFIYALLALVPVAVALELLHAPPIWIFATSALALIPLAAILGKGTEELAIHTGPRIGGLLNATLGNAAELIITIVALSRGLQTLVKASLVGSILGNILVVLGASLLLGGLRHGTQRFNRTEAGVVAALLMLSVIAMAVPTAFAATVQENITFLSDEVSVVMLMMYAAYLAYSFFGVGRKPREGAAREAAVHATPHASLGEADPANTRQPLPDAAGTHSATPAHGGEHKPAWSMPFALGVLAVSTIAIVFMAEFLVGAIDSSREVLGWSEFFVGLIIVPLVGNIAEHIVGVQVAWKNQMDLSLGISLGSSLQIALFVAPVLVLLSLFIGERPMSLVFLPFEIIALVSAVAVAVVVSLDGESNWLEGALLVGVYAILGLAAFFIQ